MENVRLQRVSETIREELSEIIEYEMEDPRVEGVRISDVLVSSDSKKARILIWVPSADGAADALTALQGARAYLRTQLALRLQMRRTPELLFERNSDVNPDRVDTLLKRIKRGRPRD